MTKLKKPITLTITSAEEALNIYHRLNFPSNQLTEFASRRNPATAYTAEITFVGEGSAWRQLNVAMSEQGISPDIALPQPLKFGTCEVRTEPSGAITFGCQKITRAEIEAAYKLSTEAMASDWPKFMVKPEEAGSVLEFHEDHSQSLWHYGHMRPDPISIYDNADEAKRNAWTFITALEAARILEAKQ